MLNYDIRVCLVFLSDDEGWLKQKVQRHSTIYRLICFVLTLPVSTATTERSFSAVKLIKREPRNKIINEFLADYMFVYIGRGFPKEIDMDSVIDKFDDKQDCRLRFK